MHSVAPQTCVGNNVWLVARLDGQNRTSTPDTEMGEAVVGQIVGELVGVVILGSGFGHVPLLTLPSVADGFRSRREISNGRAELDGSTR